MDKFEYKVRADEIKELIAEGEYAQAAEIADTIDWRRVKSVMMLCTISDLYKINRRYEDAKNMLLLAYERRPGGKTICYSLCELCIKTEEFVQAVNYYKEFVQAAPKDSGRYILQYKLYEAQDVGLEERISVLEELKKRDYREKWAYELAYLYHRVGLGTRCVEECDELILWFGEGKYVIKAMELKMLHQPLTAAQQQKYDHRFDNWEMPASSTEGEVPEESQGGWEQPVEEQTNQEAAPDFSGEETEAYFAPEENAQVQPEEMDIQVKTMDVGRYNTINLQAELAAGLKEVLSGDRQKDAITRSILAPMMDSDTESLDLPAIEEVDESDLEPEAEEIEKSEVFFGETGDLGSLSQENIAVSENMEEILPQEPEAVQLQEESGIAAGRVEIESVTAEEATAAKAVTAERSTAAGHAAVGKSAEAGHVSIKNSAEAGKLAVEKSGTAGAVTGELSGKEKSDETAEIVMNQLRRESLGRAEEQVLTAQPPKELAGVLSQESDGQISLVVPESEAIEKQITGQMSLEDILAEWERMKEQNAEKRKEEVRQHVLEQTGNMFTEFEASVRDGLLEKLESGQAISEEAASEEPEFAEPVETEKWEEEFAEPGEPEFAEPEETEKWEEEFAEPGEPEVLEPEFAEPEETEQWEEKFAELGEPEVLEEEFAEPEESELPESEFTEAEEPEHEESSLGYETGEAFGESDGYGGDSYGGTEEIEETEEVKEIEDETEEIEEDRPEEDEPEEPEEEKAEKIKENRAEKSVHAHVEREKAKVRALTREEKELYVPFIQSRSGREKLVKAIDNVSMAAYTGNIIITGEEGMDTLSLAKNMIREVQMTDSNFSGKVAKISGKGMNSKNVGETLERLKSGALIIQKAAEMKAETAEALHKALQKESFGIIVVLEDTKKAMDRLLAACPRLEESFTARMNVEALSNDTLVAYGKQYAREQEYSIDELGVLALHTRIEELQTIDHVVTVAEVKEIMDEAIRHANKKSLGHFFDILFAKRYDDEDMIILTEKDFV